MATKRLPASDWTTRHLIIDEKEIVDIFIPNTIDAILDNTFKHFGNIKSVVIPNNIRHMKDECFKDCKYLTSVYLPGKLLTHLSSLNSSSSFSVQLLDFLGRLMF